MNWKVVTFNDLLTESRIPSENPDVEKRIRVKLNVQGVEKRPVGAEKEGATKQFIRRAGQFIYGKQNFHKGAFGIVPKELDGYETSADIPAFDVSKDCLPEWIYYYFKAGNRFLELAEFARGVGSQRIHPKQLAGLQIPLPPMEIQQRIIGELKLIEEDEITSELHHQLDLVKQLRHAFLREAMQGKLVPQNPDNEPASELLEKIKAEKDRLVKEKKLKKQKPLAPVSEDEIPFEIPENWVWCRLGEICSLITSGSRSWNKYYAKEGALFIRSQNIKASSIDLTNQAYVKPPASAEGKRTEVQKNDILITITGAGVSNAAILEEIDFQEGYVSQHIALIRLIRPEVAAWIHNCIISANVGEKQFSDLIYGDKPGLNLNQLNNLIVPVPPFFEQGSIFKKLKELMQYCDALEENIQESLLQNELLLHQVLREALEPKEVELTLT